jgi:YebC/PmpR family DNA-binding regulatory protein
MWRWPVIEQRRNVTNAQKWKVFTIHAKLISLAAQKGWDPNKNPSLFEAIEKAKKANVPSDNIARAIKKWTWDDKDSSQIQEVYYEWYSAGWVWIIAKALTDNKNRTSSNIRHIFGKYSWNLWEMWSVSSFVFKHAGACYIDISGKKLEDLEENIIESWADDYVLDEENIVKIITQKQNLNQVVKFLESKNFNIKEYNLEYIPTNIIQITDFEKALKIIKLIEELQDDEDIEKVWFNYEMSEELQKQVLDAIEKAKFRT